MADFKVVGDSDSDSEKCDLLIAREKNIKERESLFKEFMGECEKQNQVLADLTHKAVNIRRQKRAKREADDAFKYHGNYCPTNRRVSTRIRKIKPEYESFLEPDENLLCVEDLEKVIRPPKRHVAASTARKPPPKVLSPAEVTEDMLANVSSRFFEKVYDKVDGSSCHQCRQKTLDQKTICRSSSCIGVRGQFCGPCLALRYKEDVKEALLDAGWTCPPCRGECNCSICRNRAGKAPTGILAPIVLSRGFSSVKEFLQTLSDEGKDGLLLEKAAKKRRRDEDGDTEEEEEEAESPKKKPRPVIKIAIARRNKKEEEQSDVDEEDEDFDANAEES